MRSLTFLIAVISAVAIAAPTPPVNNHDANLATPELAESPTATILFDVDGNEARASFRVPVPGKKNANERLVALSVQAVSGLGPGQDAKNVICKAYDDAGQALGKPFDLLTRSLLSGDERKRAVVGAIECWWK
ncbi:hypothetical protein OQA88_13457 [Cercophora sp. LCS_1]